MCGGVCDVCVYVRCVVCVYVHVCMCKCVCRVCLCMRGVCVAYGSRVFCVTCILRCVVCVHMHNACSVVSAGVRHV